ncbi:carboxylesterase/lipase family protein [Streptacidiphilus sp. N1-10]|uniref:Carboxylic ester hydrolase n=1 Tax=Streptacidiphilus jeojiensis TaxID=3229225 RepID=A0ABV6XYU6_9ACTN
MTQHGERTVVRTARGAVRGVPAEGGGVAFKGIPYAAPPFGANRFRPPQPPAPWQGERDATGYGPTAPKPPYPAPLDSLLPEVDIPGEDCLNLNIWAPADRESGGRPVMVWLHGGGFTNGSGSVPGYDGSRFARDGVVCVTVNYRLGVEGFLYLGADDPAPANLGLVDQIAALEWVRDNIADFGGDPGQVTLFGQSAGAMSIGTLLAVPRAQGLFRRAILQSGAAQHTLSPGTAELVGRHLARRLGIPATREAFAAVPLDRLLPVQRGLRGEISADPEPERWGEAALNLMPLEPVVDGDLLPVPPLEALAAGGTDGATAGVDLLIGSNSDEFRLYLTPSGLLDLVPEELARRTAAGYGLDDPDRALAVYRERRPDASPGELLAAVATDWFFRIPAIRVAESRWGEGRGTVHLYEFGWQPPTFGGRLGACHVSELGFVFDNLQDKSMVELLGTDPPQRLADSMHAAWVAFAATGDPGWPVYDRDRRATMHFDLEPELRYDPRPRERELWEGRR